MNFRTGLSGSAVSQREASQVSEGCGPSRGFDDKGFAYPATDWRARWSFFQCADASDQRQDVSSLYQKLIQSWA